MKNFKNLKKALIILFVLAGMFACSDDDNSVPFKVFGDVYVIKRIVDNEAKYAIAYAAHGNQPMSVAKVSLPQGSELTLTPTDASMRIWNNIPAKEVYTNIIPAENNYQFLVVNEDINHQATDLLTFDNIDTTIIKSVSFVTEGLSIEWESNPFGEGYRVLLINSAGQLAFRSLPLLEIQKQLIFNHPTASGTWYETPSAGKSYTIELHTYRYEDDATESEYDHEIQEINVSESDIIWQ
ncbi:MAG TPA: hypothetical protein VEP89_05185 [Draconibacterium sp.]|nr:hypothetical protein [Draconibacterium sp.]